MLSASLLQLVKLQLVKTGVHPSKLGQEQKRPLLKAHRALQRVLRQKSRSITYEILMKMKSIDEAGLIDLGIPLDKTTSETYPEYVQVLRDEAFRKKANGDEIDGSDIPFN